MGMKPRKKATRLSSMKLSKEVLEGIKVHNEAIAEILELRGIPKDRHEELWSFELEDDYNDLYEDDHLCCFCMGRFRESPTS